MRRFLFLAPFLLLSVFCTISFAQFSPSIHQIESEYYARHPELVGKEPLLKSVIRTDLAKTTGLTHAVYGFHPYWVSTSIAQFYYYNLLSHIVHFSAEVDANGNLPETRNWLTTPLYDYAKNNNTKLHLCVTMFSNHSSVLLDAGKRMNLINNILYQLTTRGDGINIDFEAMSSSLAQSFRTFIVQLGDSLQKRNKELTVCLPSVDWSKTMFDAAFFSVTKPYVAYYFLMEYAYYWSGSSTAGPVAPLGNGSRTLDITNSINTYLSIGLPPEKFIAGFPYYGYDWPVVNSARMAATTATGKSVLYNAAKQKLPTLPAQDKFFDLEWNVPWYRYNNGTNWQQAWYDDSISLAMKYNTVKMRGLGGTGMWALGYDYPHPELWGALKSAFSIDSVEPLTEIPLAYVLSQNFPNPFNPSTELRFSVAKNSHATLQVFDIIGRRVAILFDQEAVAGTSYRVHFDGTNLASCVYIYRLDAGGVRLTRKMMLVR
jgi:spore germination protein YaaH